MKLDLETQTRLRNYLLGQCDEAECEAVETMVFTDDDLFEELQVLEDEIIDEYLNDKLSPEARTHFEEHFLAAPERVEQLRFASTFDRYVESKTVKPVPVSRGWFHNLYSSPARVAAFAVVVVVIVLAAWQLFFRQSQVDKGLLALNAAYREQRPTEARISNFDYAPFVVTRGPNDQKVNQNELTRAELTLLEALNENPSGAAHHALGKVYLAKGDFDKAIEQFDAAVKTDSNNSQLYGDLGAAWLEKGKRDRDGTEPRKGMEELGRALENLNKALALNPNSLEALFNRALCEEQMTAYSQAETHWREYLTHDSNSQWADEARRRLQALEEKKKRGAQTKQELFKNFLQAYETHNDDAAWSALSRSRGRTGNLIVEALLDDFFSSQDNEQALRKLTYAGEVETAKAGDTFTRDLAHTLTAANAQQRQRILQGRNLVKDAISRYDISEFKEAIEIFSDADQEFLAAGDECNHMFVQSMIGYCYLRIPEAEKAFAIFQPLSQSFAAKSYKSMLAQSLYAQADALNGKNEFSKALELANDSFALSQKIEDQANSVRSLQARTSLQLMFGDYNESLRAAFQALKLAEELPPDPKITWPFYHEASLDFYFLNLPASALLFENEALQLATAGKLPLPLQASRSHDRLAVIHEHLGNYSEAIKNNELARAQGEKLSNKTRTNVLAHAAMVLGRLYRETGKPEQAVEAFDTSLALYKELGLDVYQYQGHKGKLLALLQMNDNAAAQSELDQTLFWFEQNRENIAQESFRDKFFDAEQDTYDLAVDFTYSRMNDPVKALNFAEASRARSLNDLMNKGARSSGDKSPEFTPALKVNEIQGGIPEHTQLLTYAVLPDKIITWVITRQSIKPATVAISRNDLNQKAEQYLRLLTRASPNEADVMSQAKELYAALIKPAEGYLDHNLQLCIIPDDKLNFVPFVSLVSPDSGRYLIEDYTLQVAPSATVFISSSKNAELRRTSGPERLLVVGNPHFDRTQFADLPDLPSAKREAEEIANVYGATPLTGDGALASRVTSALTQSDVVHLATHTVTDNESPLLSKLLLAADRDETHHASSTYITAADIYRMKLNRTRLVVLSACQTGVEKTYRGEGAIGLARPFIAAGVPLVIASLWPVESDATADLMVSFHNHRKHDHVSTTEALRRAQLEALRAGRGNYQWAAFVTVGGYADF